MKQKLFYVIGVMNLTLHEVHPYRRKKKKPDLSSFMEVYTEIKWALHALRIKGLGLPSQYLDARKFHLLIVVVRFDCF